MIHKIANHVYRSDLLSQIPGLMHGFSARGNGDMRDARVRHEFITSLGINPANQVNVRQIHSNRVLIFSGSLPQDDQDLPGADAIIYDYSTDHVSPFLEIQTADCVPVVIFDDMRRIGAAVHAGWKGIVKNIILKTISSMVKNGACPGRIKAAVGPHIKSCCYDVDAGRAALFRSKFPGQSKIIISRMGKQFLDLSQAVKLHLVKSGLRKNNIDVSGFCTCCYGREFFSYRRDRNGLYGKQIGYLSWKN